MNILSQKEKVFLVCIAVLIVLNIFVWQELFSWVGGQYLKVVFFNVGQGDAIFIETPQRHQILIDGGPDSTVLEKLAKELPFWDRTIDLIILTHPEKDHLVGLIEILKRYKIDYILWTGVVREIPEYKEWKELIKKEEAEITIAKSGQKIRAGRVFLDILYPLENFEGKEFKNSNDTSIVSRLVFEESTFLFTGDISSKGELELVEKGLVEGEVYLKSEVLKVAHHGSKYSSSENFLTAVEPEIAIIQVGKNSYGHPTEEALQRLKKFAIEILRTDKNGDIKFISDGKHYRITQNRENKTN